MHVFTCLLRSNAHKKCATKVTVSICLYEYLQLCLISQMCRRVVVSPGLRRRLTSRAVNKSAEQTIACHSESRESLYMLLQPLPGRPRHAFHAGAQIVARNKESTKVCFRFYWQSDKKKLNAVLKDTVRTEVTWGKIAVGLVGQVTVNGEKSHHFCCSLHLLCLVSTATADEEPKLTCEHPEIPTTAYKHNPPQLS